MAVSENLAQRVKQLLIAELRYYFQNVSQFGFPDSPISMPIVREAYGLDIRQYPIIIIKILHEESKNLGIGRDFVEDVLSDDQLVGQEDLPGTEHWKKPIPYKRRTISERFGYMADVTFNLQVWGDTTAVRNRTVDEIFAALRYYQRQSLLDSGVQIMRLSMGEETDYPLDLKQKIYIANMNLVVNAELYFENPVNSITAVKVYKVTTNPYGKVGPSTSPDQPSYIVEDDNGNPYNDPSSTPYTP